MNAYRFLLGRRPESEAVVAEKSSLGPKSLAVALMSSSEFDQQIVESICRREPVVAGDFRTPSDRELLDWAASFLPLSGKGRQALREAPGWASACAAALADPVFAPLAAASSPRVNSNAFKSALSALADAEAARGIIGGLDEINPDRVTGWALNRHDPAERIAVDLLVNGAPAGAAVTGLFRRELQEIYGGDGLFGFEIRNAASHGRDGDAPAWIEVRDSASKIRLGEGRLLRPRRAEAAEFQALREEVRGARVLLERLEARLDQSAQAFGFPLALYDDYRRAYYLRTPADALSERAAEAAFRRRPHFTVMFVADGEAIPEIEPLAESLVEQSYPDATLAIVYEIAPRRRAEGLRSRAEAVLPNRVICGRPESVLRDGDIAVLLAPGEVLAPDALHWIAAALQDETARPPIIFADEDHVRAVAGGRKCFSDPVFRTAFDPLVLLQQNWLHGLLAVEGDLLRRVLSEGGSLATARRHDLTLRLTEAFTPSAIRHIPRVLGHLSATEAKPVADADAVRRSLDRRRLPAEVDAGGAALTKAGRSALRVRWRRETAARAAVIIPTKDRADLLGPCVASLLAEQARSAASLQIIVVNNGGDPDRTAALLRSQGGGSLTTQLEWDHPFNWSAINNFAAATTDADVLIFLNDDTVALTPDWADQLCGQALQPGTGAVGARLLYPDGTIQHAGMVFGGDSGGITHEGVGNPADEPGYMGRNLLVRRVSAVTGACLATSAKSFQAVGGFDEETFDIDANDVDFCLRLERIGLATIYDPYCTFYHFESKSRGYTTTDPGRTQRAIDAAIRLQRRWGDRLRNDPFYNPHFDRMGRPFDQLGPPPSL